MRSIAGVKLEKFLFHLKVPANGKYTQRSLEAHKNTNRTISVTMKFLVRTFSYMKVRVKLLDAGLQTDPRRYTCGFVYFMSSASSRMVL